MKARDSLFRRQASVSEMLVKLVLKRELSANGVGPISQQQSLVVQMSMTTICQTSTPVLVP